MRPSHAATRGLLLPVLALAVVPATAIAQTDYFNTDRGRPLHVQDATAIERYAFELQAAPLRWARSTGARVLWSIEPELAYGILPRTQLEVGLPVFVTEGSDGDPDRGVGAVHVSILHALNVETLEWPGLAVNAAVAIPAGDFGPQRTYAMIGAIATRTMGWGRIHLNADVTPGPVLPETDDGPALHDFSRWTSGIAVDRSMPLRSLLVGAEVVAKRPLREAAAVEWRAATGVRWQVNPYWAIDAGIGRTFGDEREWSLTFGAARAFGLIKLFPVNR